MIVKFFRWFFLICMFDFFINNVFVCFIYIMQLFWNALFKFFLMQVLLKLCIKENRVSSVDCFNDVYLWCHLCRKRFKWCVCKKSFSHIWAELSEHMNCHSCHAHFCMHFIHCDSISIYISICNHRQRNISLFKWFKWLKDVFHNVCNMILIELLCNDNYDLWLF